MPAARRAAPEAAEEEKVSKTPGSTSEGGILPSARMQTDPAYGTTYEGDVKIRRSDDDALTGLFAIVIDGEHRGKLVVVGDTVERADDGYPKTVIVKTRDSRDEQLVVDYADLRPARRY